jgi:adenylosuccinate lyase
VQEAHDVIYDAAQAAATTGRPFADLLAEDETVNRHLSPEDIAAKLDPEAYTGSCAVIARTQAKRARTVADDLSG